MKRYEATDATPISAWGYIGRSFLYALPIAGFVFLILHAFTANNINTRNYARSIFISMIILIILYAVLVALAVVLVLTTDFTFDINGGEYEVFNRVLDMIGT